jgi:hypothetical protein
MSIESWSAGSEGATSGESGSGSERNPRGKGMSRREVENLIREQTALLARQAQSLDMLLKKNQAAENVSVQNPPRPNPPPNPHALSPRSLQNHQNNPPPSRHRVGENTETINYGNKVTHAGAQIEIRLKTLHPQIQTIYLHNQILHNPIPVYLLQIQAQASHQLGFFHPHCWTTRTGGW